MSPTGPMVPLPRRDRRRQLRASDVDKLKKIREPGQNNWPGTLRNERTHHQLRELIFHRLCPQIRKYTQKNHQSSPEGQLEVTWSVHSHSGSVRAAINIIAKFRRTLAGPPSRESHILHISASFSYHVSPVGVIETERESRFLHIKVPMTRISRLHRHHLPPEAHEPRDHTTA